MNAVAAEGIRRAALVAVVIPLLQRAIAIGTVVAVFPLRCRRRRSTCSTTIRAMAPRPWLPPPVPWSTARGHAGQGACGAAHVRRRRGRCLRDGGRRRHLRRRLRASHARRLFADRLDMVVAVPKPVRRGASPRPCLRQCVAEASWSPVRPPLFRTFCPATAHSRAASPSPSGAVVGLRDRNRTDRACAGTASAVAEVATPFRQRPEGRWASSAPSAMAGASSARCSACSVPSARCCFYGVPAVLLASLSVLYWRYRWSSPTCTGLVPRFPTAILATGLMLLAALGFLAGLVLDTVTRVDARCACWRTWRRRRAEHAPARPVLRRRRDRVHR